jgi:magnesium transporter
MSLLSFTGIYNPFRHKSRPGAPPGVVHSAEDSLPTSVRLMAYSDGTLVDESDVTPEQLQQLMLPEGVTWIDVVGLRDTQTITRIGEMFGLHPLSLEDVVHVHQRPKVEVFGDHLFVIARMVSLPDRLEHEQVAIFLGKNYVVTFQERPGDCLEPVRQRLRDHRGRIRTTGSDYLAYALLDAIIDHYFPIIEAYGGELDRIEQQIDEGVGDRAISELHDIRSDLLVMRKLMWSHREAIHSLLCEEHPLIDSATLFYLRDCYDHTIQIVDLVETYRETCGNLRDFHFSLISQKTNDIMKLLTIISSIFIPLSFIAGVYGMNFDPEASPWNMPELHWFFGYPFALLLMLLVAGGMLTFFWRRGWLRRN